jgi:hypothetical protein
MRHHHVNNFCYPCAAILAFYQCATNICSGPNSGFEIIVPGRQDLFARRILIPLAGAPISFERSPRIFFLPGARLCAKHQAQRLDHGGDVQYPTIERGSMA